MPVNDDGIPQGRVRRVTPVLGVAARTSGEAVVAAVRRRVTGAEDTGRQQRAAEQYAEVLGRSKGALMKVGQLLSFVAMEGAVAPELGGAFQTALGRLRADAPPMPAEVARRVIEQELGPAVERFASLDPEPLAAASIGQVHAARLDDGRQVVVKVQYPGVAAAIRADLANTELLLTFLRLTMAFSPARIRVDLRAVAGELATKIGEELDYGREAVNQRHFAELYAGHPFIRIPAVVDELSTGRVLTQEHAVGRAWEDAVAAPQELRDRWGETVSRFTYGSLNHFRMLNADPHPGNFVFHDDGTVSFLDFGCVERLDPRTGEHMTSLMQACLRGDRHRLTEVALDAGLWDADDAITPEAAQAYWSSGLERFRGPQPFTVTPERVAAWNAARWSATGEHAGVYRRLRAPRGWTFTGRTDAALCSVLGGLRATADWAAQAAEFYEREPPVSELGKLQARWLAGHPTAIRHA